LGRYATRQGTYVEYECRVTASGSLIRVPSFLATVQIPRWISIEIDLDPPTWLVPGSTSNVEPGTTTTYVLVVLTRAPVQKKLGGPDQLAGNTKESPRGRGRVLSRVHHSDVEGIQGSRPQILFWGGWLPKIAHHGDNPPLAHPLHAISPPPR